MAQTDTAFTHLMELAADYRRRTDHTLAERRRSREAYERQAAAITASNFVLNRFWSLLGKVLPAEAWQGYPSSVRDPRTTAVAHLGAGLFLMHSAKRDGCGDDECGCRHTVTLLRPCRCGDYIEDVVDTEYDLAFILSSIDDTTCVGLCTPSGWHEAPWE
ncbi:hypothetical protein ACFY2W_05355 [Streptomyces sp. NPDC001262]|uniref:hypothetical protein n=1 Tax=Streptomyces sp. NPDC001262 TaxID=3364552 RepID=UPI0036AC8FB1